MHDHPILSTSSPDWFPYPSFKFMKLQLITDHVDHVDVFYICICRCFEGHYKLYTYLFRYVIHHRHIRIICREASSSSISAAVVTIEKP